MAKWPLERICRWLIGLLLCLTVPAWIARRLFGVTAVTTTLTPILCVASLAVLLLSYYAIRHPQEDPARLHGGWRPRGNSAGGGHL